MCGLPRRSFFLWDVTQTFWRASRDIPGNDCEGECRRRGLDLQICSNNHALSPLVLFVFQ